MPVREVKLVELPQNFGENMKAIHPSPNKEALFPPEHWARNSEENLDISHEIWLRMGLSIASTFGENGRSLFLAVSQGNESYPNDTVEILNEYYDGLLDDADPKYASKASVAKKLEECGVKLGKYPPPPVGAFWTIVMSVTKNGEAKEIIECEFHLIVQKTLPFLGFSITQAGNYMREISPGVVRSDIEFQEMAQAISAYIKEQDESIQDTLFSFTSKRMNLLDDKVLRTLVQKEFPRMRSDKDFLKYALEDGVFSMAKKTKEKNLNPYEDLDDEYVFEEMVLPISYEALSEEKANESIIKEFVELISSDLTKTLVAIGLLLDSYKDPALSKAVVITDEKASHDGISRGGTGKDLLGMAVSFVIPNTSRISGKRFDPTNQFNLQSLKPNSDILWIEDLAKGIKEEPLFIMISGHVEVELKMKKVVTLSYEEAPKIFITTNFPFEGIGPSSTRRFVTVELTDYFNEQHAPIDEFGHRLYYDWDPEEWERFFSYMFYVVIPTYLDVGVRSQKTSKNYIRNQVIGVTSEDFFDFCQSIDLNTDQNEDDIANLRNKFLKDAGEDSKFRIERNLSTFSKWLKIYVQSYLGLVLTTRKSNSKTMYMLEDVS